MPLTQIWFLLLRMEPIVTPWEIAEHKKSQIKPVLQDLFLDPVRWNR